MIIGCSRSYKLFTIFLLFVFTGLASFGQQSDSCVLKLKTYTVKPCLNELLTSIVKSNTCKGEECFYSLSLFKGIGSQVLTVTTNFWKNAKFTDYSGIVKIKNASIVLRGEFDDGILFKETPLPRLEIKLMQPQPDTSEMFFIHEPVLQGYFSPCFISKPIYIEVYTKSGIKGYKMDIPKEAGKEVVILKK